MSLSRLVTQFLDPDQAGRVKDSTLQLYRSAAQRFVRWAREEDLCLLAAEDWDTALVIYKNVQKERGLLTRSNFITLVAAVEFFFPTHKTKLPWSHAVTNGWNVVAQVKHTVPMGLHFAKLVAVHFGALNWGRLGIGVCVQCAAGLRPSEMLNLHPVDVIFPEDLGRTLSDFPVQINVGPRTNTKLKRPQVAYLFIRHQDVVEALRALCHKTVPDQPLFPFTLDFYRRALRKVEGTMGLSTGWGPHSPRAGFASDGRAQGMSFTELRELGRWQADSSLRTYLDIVASSSLLVQAEAKGLKPAVAWASHYWRYYVD
jgi:integrase